MVETQNDCPQCGESIPVDAPNGICPRCILDVGLGDADFGVTSPASNANTSHPGGLFTVPEISELSLVFPDLEIIELVGQGGMGAVYKVRQKSLDRIVALKILPSSVDGDPKFAERFTREARALAKLTHPNIVMIFEFGQAGPYHYFLMEFIDGVNLRETLRSGKISPEQALTIVPQICDALQFAHEEGIVHRDIKPENVLIDRRGRVRIADFGLAKLLRKDETSHTLTGTRQIMGTPHYMAPEQMEKPLTVDHRADIYSLGVVFYELLTGELPIGRFDPPSMRADMNSSLDDVVLRSLEKEPARRYQNISEVKSAVSSISDEKPPRNPPPVRPASPVTPPKPAQTVFVPFHVEDDWGVNNAQGILSCDGSVVKVEFRKETSGLGNLLKGKIKEAIVPLSEVAEVKSNSYLRYRKIKLLTRNMELIKTVPASSAGRITFKTSPDDAEAADRLVASIEYRLQGMPWEEVDKVIGQAAPEQLHPLGKVAVDEVKVRNRLHGPIWGLVVVAVINMIAAGVFGLILWKSFWGLPPFLNADTDWIPTILSHSIYPAGPILGALAAASVMVSLLQLFVAFSMTRREAWPTSLGVGIATILPIHLAFVPGLIVGVWIVSALGHRHIRAAYYQAKFQEDFSLPMLGSTDVKPTKPIA